MLVCVFPLCARETHIVVPSWTQGSDDPSLQGSTSFSILMLPSGTLWPARPLDVPRRVGLWVFRQRKRRNSHLIGLLYAWEVSVELHAWFELNTWGVSMITDKVK